MITSRIIIKNFLWRFFERSGSQAISLLVSIILARLLAPSDYGKIAIILILINFLQVFVDSGFGIALIQKKDADDSDFSTVFFFNIAVGTLFSIVIFSAAPFIAQFFNISDLDKAIKALSPLLFLFGIKNTLQSFISKKLLFRKQFFSTLYGTFTSAFIGIFLAYHDYGIWALVWQQLSSAFITTFTLCIIVPWRPKLIFSYRKLKDLFHFGWKLLLTSFIDTGYSQLRQILISKIYTPQDLAFYNRGSQFPTIIESNLGSSINSVLFPAMAIEQDDTKRLKDIMKKTICISSYIMIPFMIILAISAEPLVKLVLSEKWLPCVPFLRVFCITSAFSPIHTANMNAIKAIGRSDLILKMDILKKSIGIILIIITAQISVMAMAYSLIISNVCSQIINSWPNKKIFNYSYINQMKDFIPQTLLSIVIGFLVYPISFIETSEITTIFIQCGIFIFLYIKLSSILNLYSYKQFLIILGNFVSHKKQSL